jgi:protein disulfide-isomerase A1
MAPAYATAAGHFSSTDNIRLAKVDATIHKELATTYGVKGFPTLLFFNNGEKLEY